MPFTITPARDSVTGQSVFEIPEGTPAVLKTRVSEEDFFWSISSKKKKNGKRKTLFLVDNDFAYIDYFSPSDTFSFPSDPDAYTMMPAPYIEGHSIVMDQRSRTNVIALINDPSGFFS